MPNVNVIQQAGAGAATQAPQAPSAPPAPEQIERAERTERAERAEHSGSRERIVTRDGDKTITVDQDGVHIERTTSGTGVPQNLGPVPMIPPQAVDISVAFFTMIAVVSIGTPLARAFGRRMDRKSLAPPPAPDESARLARIENALEAVAVEVERIGEGQRYVTQLMATRAEPMARLAEGGTRAS